MMKTILIVDDDPDMRKLATIILSKEGYGIIEAEDGSIALDLVKEKNTGPYYQRCDDGKRQRLHALRAFA